MNNNLSKQLCELCGIEYEKHEPVAATNGVVQAYSKTTLDFTKPVNFARLLELKPYGDRTIFYIVTKTVVVQHCTGIYNQNDFIFCLKNYCLDKSIKRLIREAEWVYAA